MQGLRVATTFGDMAPGLSERSLSEWSAFAQSAGADASNPFDVGPGVLVI